jgi:hypothetical protein
MRVRVGGADGEMSDPVGHASPRTDKLIDASKELIVSSERGSVLAR